MMAVVPTLTAADPTRLHRARGALAHSVSSDALRRSLRVRSADATVAIALRVGLAAAVVLVAFGVTGHASIAGFAVLGSLSSAFSRHEPFRRTAHKVGFVGLLVVVAVLVGGFIALSGVPGWAQIGLMAILSAVGAAVILAFRIAGPGPVVLVFAATAAVGFVTDASHLGVAVASAAIGAAIGLSAAVIPFPFLPWGPARLATARALGALARVPGGGDAAAAKAAIVAAREKLALTTRSAQHGHARDLAAVLVEGEEALDTWLVHGDRSRLDAVVRHERELRKVKRHSAILNLGNSADAAAPLPEPAPFVAVGVTELRSRAVAIYAGRVVVAAAVAGWVAAGFGLEHPLWASMGAIAAIQGVTYVNSVDRGIQRLLGNVAGAALAAGLIALSLGYWQTAVVIVVCQAGAEMMAVRNYALCTLFVTPMALLVVGLGSDVGPEIGISRVLDTLVGVVVGVVVAAVTITRSDRAHLPAAA